MAKNYLDKLISKNSKNKVSGSGFSSSNPGVKPETGSGSTTLEKRMQLDRAEVDVYRL